jgi:A/G-specific adenine glycosylase
MAAGSRQSIRKRAETPLQPKSIITDAFSKRLCQWFRENQRPLPWRLNPTPYRVWISEIMLQQTQAKTVIPYYNRFLRHFPNVSSLALASEETILTLWSGLGYYNRARNLLRAARQIVKFHDGIFPTDYKTVLSLPGIGRYTAGAICSIALHQPQPIVEGNIRRVLTRLKGIRKFIPEKFFWDQMSAWIPDREASIFNQAIMELGATVCLPTQPLCSQCPVRTFCGAKRKNLQNTIPLPRPRKRVDNVEILILVLRHKTKILLTRQENSFIPGLWGFPYGEVLPGQSTAESADRLSKRLFGVAMSIESRTAVRHSITNHRILAHIFTGEIKKTDLLSHKKSTRIQWANDLQLRRLLTSSLFRKALAHVSHRVSQRGSANRDLQEV